MVTDNKDQYEELYKDVYSYSLTNELVKLLSEFIKKKYTEEYVKISDNHYDGVELPGKKYGHVYCFILKWSLGPSSLIHKSNPMLG